MYTLSIYLSIHLQRLSGDGGAAGPEAEAAEEAPLTRNINIDISIIIISCCCC